MASREVGLLPDNQAMEIVIALGGRRVAELHGTALVAQAAGLPIQLCPATRSAAKALRRHGGVQLTITNEAKASFASVWDRLEPEGRLVLAAATLFNPDRIRADLLRARGCGGSTVDRGSCRRCTQRLHGLVPSSNPARRNCALYRLLREYVRLFHCGARFGAAGSIRGVALACACARCSAGCSGDHPADRALVDDFLSYPFAPDDWSLAGRPLSFIWFRLLFGRLQALTSIGLFDEARPWYERAVAEEGEGRRAPPRRPRKPGPQPAPGRGIACCRRETMKARDRGTSARSRRRRG